MRRKLTVLIGLSLILAGLVWYAYTLQESNRAAWTAREVIPQLHAEIAVPSAPDATTSVSQQWEMTEQVVDGIAYIGVLEIPDLSLKLPVIGSWSTENAKIAPCRYVGSVYENDLILCAHNYESHFGKLNTLKAGDTVRFTDLDGIRYSYEVKESIILAGTDTDGILEGDWDMTLFTCTPGGKMRYCVRCNLIL